MSWLNTPIPLWQMISLLTVYVIYKEGVKLGLKSVLKYRKRRRTARATDIANQLEAMCCNAPRAACGNGRPCECTTLRAAARLLKDTAVDNSHPPRYNDDVDHRRQQ